MAGHVGSPARPASSATLRLEASQSAARFGVPSAMKRRKSASRSRSRRCSTK
jgi:hypothetical protein